MTPIEYEKLVNQILDKSLDLDKLTEMVEEEQKRRKEQEKDEKRKAEVAKCQKALVDAVYDWVCLTDFEEGKRPPAGSVGEFMAKQRINYIFDALLEDTDFKDTLSDLAETKEKKEKREPDTLDINDLNTDPLKDWPGLKKKEEKEEYPDPDKEARILWSKVPDKNPMREWLNMKNHNGLWF